MRLFVALEIPAGPARALSERAALLARELPPAKWVRRENLHLTMVFLGEVERDELEALDAALEAPFRRAAPFELAVGGAGTFPPRRPARVAWVGLAAPPALERLQAGVAEAASPFAERTPDRRRFHPHLTLGRCRRPWPRAAVERWRRGFDELDVEPFAVDDGVLVESRLSPRGPAYRTLERYPMAAA